MKIVIVIGSFSVKNGLFLGNPNLQARVIFRWERGEIDCEPMTLWWTLWTLWLTSNQKPSTMMTKAVTSLVSHGQSGWPLAKDGDPVINC